MSTAGPPERPVFITGGTGYIGRPLIGALLQQGYPVHALVRSGAESRLPPGAVPVAGDALDGTTFSDAMPAAATVVHLVGTPHPNPSKAAEFRRVDLASIRATAAAALQAAARQIVYVSVAHPAPIMQAYIAVRQEGEAIVRATGMPATILRPWYVLGPGHRWPYALVPVYAVLRRLPATRAGAERLGLVTRPQMVAALVRAVEAPPPAGLRIVEVPEIRRSAVA
jgi:uncharacterized protein YbjT (DUF2867 family)